MTTPKRKLDFFAWYPAAYRADTRHLTREEHFAYREIIDEIFLSDQETCRIKDDDEYLREICRATPDEWKTIRRTLIDGPRALLTRKGRFIHSRRLTEEIERAKDKTQKRRDAANQRWGKQTDANALQTHSNAMPIEKKRREEKREPVFPSSTQVLGVADSEAKLVIKNPELPEDGLAAIDIIDRTWSIVVPSADPLDEFTVAKWLQLRHHHPWCIAAAICEAEGKLREVVRPDGYLRGIVEAREDWPCDTAQDFVTYSLDPARRAKLSIVVGGVA